MSKVRLRKKKREGSIRTGAQLTVGSGTGTPAWCYALGLARTCAFKVLQGFFKTLICMELTSLGVGP